jgi:hypothetical protein
METRRIIDRIWGQVVFILLGKKEYLYTCAGSLKEEQSIFILGRQEIPAFLGERERNNLVIELKGTEQ